jgi:hypothetical protein
MSEFLDELDVRLINDESNLWVINSVFRYKSDLLGGAIITVPIGFRTNFASVPRLPLAYLLFGGVANKAAVVHDYLYSTGKISRSKADAVLKEASKVSGVGWFRRQAMWLGVRAGGSSHYGK